MIDEKIITMIAKDGKKKAVDKVKIYEQVIQDFEKKKNGLEIIINLSKEKVFQISNLS